jgi:hypothetical protein
MVKSRRRRKEGARVAGWKEEMRMRRKNKKKTQKGERRKGE